MGILKYNSDKVNSAIKANDGRTTYFNGFGVNLNQAQSLETAIQLSGLDFEVIKKPIAFINDIATDLGNGDIVTVQQPIMIPDQYATVRSDTNAPLGVVGKNYTILQNKDAFDFLDDIGQDIKYETAGTYGKTGAKSVITISTEGLKICGDDFAPYIALLNSFDGSGCVKAFFTPVRVFCSNTLVRALKTANNKVSIRPSSNLTIRMAQARELLLENSNYLKALKNEAEKLGTTPFSRDSFEALVRSLYPINEEDSKTVQIRNAAQIEHLLVAYNQGDLDNFRETAWGAIQAFSDAESHSLTFKKNVDKDMNNFNTVISLGMPLLNKVYDMMLERVAA